MRVSVLVSDFARDVECMRAVEGLVDLEVW